MTAKMPQPVELDGHCVRLVPLTLDHAPDLFAAGGDDEEVWRWRPWPQPTSEDDMRRHVAALLDRQDRGETTQFAVLLRETGQAIGSTGFWDVPGFDESIEIGTTWYGRAYRRTPVNTECKILLFDHAFQRLGYARVMLRTDVRNLRSQAAIERLGCVREGVLRRQYRRKDGSWRDSVIYSLLDDEWPARRARLLAGQRPHEPLR